MASKLEKLRQACASHPHGQRSRYVSGCRCALCRKANRRYQRQRETKKRAEESNRLVTADRARKHLLFLSRQGVGRRSVRAATDIAESTLVLIKTGKRRLIRETTEHLILGVNLTARADASLVPAAPAWRRLNELINDGYSKAQIARWLGYTVPALQIPHTRIRARTAVRIEQLYRRIRAGLMRRP